MLFFINLMMMKLKKKKLCFGGCPPLLNVIHTRVRGHIINKNVLQFSSKVDRNRKLESKKNKKGMANCAIFFW